VSDSHYRPSVGAPGAINDGAAGSGVFLRSYGGDDDYRSNLGVDAYGVDADIRHSVLQGGSNLYVSEGARSTLQVGLAGSTGDVSFTPHDVDGARRTKLDQWAIAPHLGWRSHQGGYVDVVFAHGEFKGGVSTMQRGHTARLKGSTQTASVETGIPFSFASLTLEPQVQVAWQRAKFDQMQDVDGFPVQLGAPEQWTVRAGAEWHKALFPDSGRHVRMSGRLHVSHAFDHDNTVWLGDSFQLGRVGNTLETGLGFDASLLGGKTMIYGDVTRQQRLGSVGNQGWSANMGIQMGF